MATPINTSQNPTSPTDSLATNMATTCAYTSSNVGSNLSSSTASKSAHSAKSGIYARRSNAGASAGGEGAQALHAKVLLAAADQLLTRTPTRHTHAHTHATTVSEQKQKKYQTPKPHSPPPPSPPPLTPVPPSTSHATNANSFDGFVHISRATTLSTALKAVIQACAPEKSSTCVRLWIQHARGTDVPHTSTSNSSNTTQTPRETPSRKATRRGDGYELIKDLFPPLVNKEEKEAVAAAEKLAAREAKLRELRLQAGQTPERTNVAKQQTATSTHKQQHKHKKSLYRNNPMLDQTVGEWLKRDGLEDVKSWEIDGNNNGGVGANTGTGTHSLNFQRNNTGAIRVEVLVETRPTIHSKWHRYGMEMCNRLQVGDFIDAADNDCKWFEAVVREINSDTIKVHYMGWSSRWDGHILRRRKDNNTSEACRKLPGPPAPLWSQTSSWREQITINDEVEVREASSLAQRPKWFRAIVKAVGKENDKVRILEGGADLELYGDNKKGREKEPILLLNGKRQVFVEVPQENFNAIIPMKQNISKLLHEQAKSKSTVVPNPPYMRWVNLYGEEICERNTHNTIPKGGGDLNGDDVAQPPATVKYIHDPKRAPVEVLRPFNNVHGAGFIREHLKGVPPCPGSVGLHNLGNSCFLNSIVQCLNHIEPLTHYFIKGLYRNDLNENNPLGSGGRVAIAYASLLNDMWCGEYSILAPRTLKTTVALFAPQFNNVYQHDSQEFCSFLMDGLHEDLNRVKVKPYVEDLDGNGMNDDEIAIETWRKHLLRHDSVVVDHCQGMHRSHLTCPKCNHESLKFDVYSTISLPITKTKGGGPILLSSCLKEFTTAEQLDMENAWYCPKCEDHVCAKKHITLWSTPDILILHLKRFTFDACHRTKGNVVRSKVEDRVNFPVDGLDLSDFIIGPIDEDSPPIYNLFGVSEHSGTTANSGHYTATVRNSRDGKWYRYNDSNVGITSGDVAITGGAYVLFYQRSRGSSKWGSMENMMKEKQIDPYNAISVDQDGFTQVKSKKKKKKNSP